jgi:hypothetical protein
MPEDDSRTTSTEGPSQPPSLQNVTKRVSRVPRYRQENLSQSERDDLADSIRATRYCRAHPESSSTVRLRNGRVMKVLMDPPPPRPLPPGPLYPYYNDPTMTDRSRDRLRRTGGESQEKILYPRSR